MLTPYYDCDGITIYNADCKQVLPSIGSFEMVVTDPPYGMEFQSNHRAQKLKAWSELSCN